MLPDLFDRLSLFLVATLAIASGGVWWQAVQKWWSHEPLVPFRERQPADWSPFVVVPTVLWIAFLLANQLLALFAEVLDFEIVAERTLQDVQLSVARNAAILFVLLAVLWGTERRGLGAFGIHLERWKESCFYGTAGFLAGILPVFAIRLMTLPFHDEEMQHPFLRLLAEHPAVEIIIWIGLAAVVFAPLTEELVFRVVLQGWLQTKLAAGWAIGISSVFFSFIHGWPDMLPLLPLSIILGYIYYRLHSFLAVVVLHALFNGIMLLLALLGLPADPDAAVYGPTGIP